MAVELAELDDMLARPLERRWLRPPEVADPTSFHRSGRGRGSRFLVPPPLGAQRRSVPLSLARVRIRSSGLPRRRLVAGSIGRGGIDPAGHRPRGLRWRRTALSARHVAHIGRRSATRALAIDRPDECGVCVIDLRHLSRRDARGSRIVAGQVRVMRPSELAPGGLDRRCVGTPGDAEHDVRIALRHTRSVPTPRGRTAARGATGAGPLDSQRRRAVPYE